VPVVAVTSPKSIVAERESTRTVPTVAAPRSVTRASPHNATCAVVVALDSSSAVELLSSRMRDDHTTAGAEPLPEASTAPRSCTSTLSGRDSKPPLMSASSCCSTNGDAWNGRLAACSACNDPVDQAASVEFLQAPLGCRPTKASSSSSSDARHATSSCESCKPQHSRFLRLRVYHVSHVERSSADDEHASTPEGVGNMARASTSSPHRQAAGQKPGKHSQRQDE